MVDLEFVDLFSLPSMPLSDRARLPPIHCVYFAIFSDSIQYIGKTNNLRTRWFTHHCFYSLNPETVIAWYEEDASLLLEIERSLIKKFSPTLNVNGGSIKRNRKFDPSLVIDTKSLKDLPQKIWETRRVCRRKLGQICHEAGVTRQYWSQIEKGQRTSIPLHTLRKIEKALGVDFGIQA